MATTYWVRYRLEDETGYREKTAKAGTLLALASQIGDLAERDWQILAIGALSPRPLEERERQVILQLTRGRVKIP